LTPLVVGRDVFVAAANTDTDRILIYDLAVASGRTRGSVKVSSTRGDAGLAFADGRLFVITQEGVAQAFDPGTGKQLWRHRLTNEPAYQFGDSPVARGKVLYLDAAADVGGRLYGLSERTGSLRWQHSFDTSPGAVSATADGAFGLDNCQLFAVAPAGRFRWTRTLRGCNVNVGGPVPILHGDKVLTPYGTFGQDAGARHATLPYGQTVGASIVTQWGAAAQREYQVSGWSLKTGKRLWTRGSAQHSDYAPANRCYGWQQVSAGPVLYVEMLNSLRVTALDLRTGARLWHDEVGWKHLDTIHTGAGTHPVEAKGRLLIASGDQLDVWTGN
jgi:hypothetical protein